MTVVVDANVLVAFGLSDEPLHAEARQILSVWKAAAETLAAPRLFRSELAAVARKVVFQQRITHEEGRAILTRLLAYPVDFYEDDALFMAAFEFSEKFNRPRAYDAQYLALSDRLSCDFWTADERLFNAVREDFPRIRWLGRWQEEA